MNRIAIVVAAGKGERFGGNIPKAMLELAGIPLMAHSLQTLNKSPYIDKIILVTSKELIPICEKDIIQKYSLIRVDDIVEGGKERQDSVMAGLKAIHRPTAKILIQDAARPFLTEKMIEKTFSALKHYDGAVIGTKLTDTIKMLSDDYRIEKTVSRNNLWSVQTPQSFNYPILIQAYQNALDSKIEMTDDAGLLEQLGRNIKLIPGSKFNIKITTPEDLALAELIYKSNFY